MKSTNIKYLFIGKADTRGIITEYVEVKNTQVQTEAKQIFDKIASSPEKKIDERNKIQSSNGIYYLTLSAPAVFFLVLAEPSYPERYVFELIDQINKDNIPLLVNEKGELNSSGKQSLKALVQKYQDLKSLSKIHVIEEDVKDIKLEMNQNIRQMMVNVEDAKNLDSKAANIKDHADLFKNNAKSLERATWWQNCKLTIIIGVVLVCVVLIIVLPLVTSK